MFPVSRVPADAALPVGRIRYDMRANDLLVHTVQGVEVLDQLLAGKTWAPDPERGEKDFAEAYDWMYRQMSWRLDTDRVGAVWVWASTTRAALVDQCRVAAHSEEESVLLTCRVPRSRLLISHFGDWHVVLNRTVHVPPLIGETPEEWSARWEPILDDFDARLDASEADRHSMATWPEDLRVEIEASWEGIFDVWAYLGERASNQTWPEVWQAVTPCLSPEAVVSAVRLRE